MMASRRPVVTIRRASVGDAEAIQATFATPKAIAGTLQLPFPSLERWRKWLADGAPDDFVLVADVAGITERRTDRMLDVSRSHGLPPFLAHEVGVDSGLMIAQYTQAGIVAELKRLAVPASVDSIPSSAMQEDHVSMGWQAARKLRRSVDGLRRVVAIELLVAARALDLRSPLKPGPVTSAVRDVIRSRVAGPGPDRHLAAEIDSVVDLLAAGMITAAAGELLDTAEWENR